VAGEKGRSELEGYVFGFVLGPIGILIVALLPTVPAGSSGSGRGAWTPDDRDDWDGPRVVSSDGMDDRVFGFLQESKSKPAESIGKIDMDAIGRADHRPREER
jgi:hypothetical protein